MNWFLINLYLQHAYYTGCLRGLSEAVQREWGGK